MSKDNKTVREFVYWPNFGLSQDGKKINVWPDAGLDVQVTLLNSLVQCVGQPMSEKCRWFRMKVDVLNTGSFIMFGVNIGCLNGMPVWDRQKSSRYISDTGGVFSKGKGEHTFHKYGPGDEVVCYIEQFYPDKCLINYFKNGKLVYRSWAHAQKDNIYATIGVKTGPAKLMVDWPKSSNPDFKFDSTSLENWIEVPSITADNEEKTFTLKSLTVGRPAYNAQAPRPLDKKNSYFEIEILNGAIDGTGLGLTSAKFERYAACGWGNNQLCQSYGYHADDGAIRRNMNNAAIVSKSEWKCGVGDKMGCGIIFEEKKIPTRQKDEQAVYIYVTKNGKILHVLGDILPLGGYYPTIFLISTGDKIRVKHPAPPPVIHIETENMCHIQKELISDFKYSYKIQFPNFENDNGAKIVVPADSDEELRHVKCIRDVFKPNDYFQITADNFRGLYIGLLPYNVTVDEFDTCYFLPKKSYIKCLSGHIKTRTINTGDTITVFLKDLIKGSAIVYFLLGDVLDKRVLGRAIYSMEENSNLYPTLLFEHRKETNLEVVWKERELIHFDIAMAEVLLDILQKDLNSWVLPSEHFTIEDMTITLNLEAECPSTIQSSAPLSFQETCFFEVTLTNTTSGTFPGIGVCSISSKPDCKLASDLDKTDSAAFFPHKNMIQCGKEMVLSEKRVSKIGDKVGCHVMFPRKNDNIQRALTKFYLNGEEIGKVIITLNATGVYAALCFESPGDSVSMNFECEPPSVLEFKPEISNLMGRMEEAADYNTTETNEPLVKQQSFGHSYGTKVGMPKINGRPVNVYVSHTNADSQKANTIFSQLSKRGYLLETTAWNATTSAKEGKIEECDVVILCISEHSINHKDQGIELVYATKKAPHRVFVIMVGSTLYPPGGLWKSHNQFLMSLETGGRKFNFLDDDMDFEIFQKKIHAAADDEVPVVPDLKVAFPPKLNIESQSRKPVEKEKKEPEKPVKNSKSKSCVLL